MQHRPALGGVMEDTAGARLTAPCGPTAAQAKTNISVSLRVTRVPEKGRLGQKLLGKIVVRIFPNL